MPGLLILVFDAEHAACRRWAERLGRLDRRGLLVFFPAQNPQLARMVPELAGRDLSRWVHAVEEGSRRVFAGADVLPEVARRLPRWGWAAPLLHLGWVKRRLYASLVGEAPVLRRPD